MHPFRYEHITQASTLYMVDRLMNHPIQSAFLPYEEERSSKRRQSLDVASIGPCGVWSSSDVSTHIFLRNSCTPGQGFSLDCLELGWDLLWYFLVYFECGSLTPSLPRDDGSDASKSLEKYKRHISSITILMWSFI